jgi:hypothetical protein
MGDVAGLNESDHFEYLLEYKMDHFGARFQSRKVWFGRNDMKGRIAFRKTNVLRLDVIFVWTTIIMTSTSTKAWSIRGKKGGRRKEKDVGDVRGFGVMLSSVV